MLYAKNVKVTLHSELEYVEKLFEHVKSGRNVQIGLKLVISACNAKIIARAKVLAKRFDLSKSNLQKDQYNLWNYKSQNPFHQKMRQAMIENKVIDENDSVSNFLVGYIRAAALLGKDSPPDAFLGFLNFSYVLSEEVELEKVLTVDQARAIRKLGDYRRALQMLREMQVKVAKRNQTMKYKQVSDREYFFRISS